MYANVPSCNAGGLDSLNRAYAVSPRSVKWENVRAGPHWVCGVKPVQSRGLHEEVAYVSLSRRHSTTFRVARQELIRIRPLGSAVHPEQIEVWSSDGSGLYRRVPVHLNQADGSLIAAPGHPNASLARVCIADSDNCVRLALFTSRHDPAPVVDEYQCPLNIRGTTSVQLRRRREKTATPFWMVNANQTVMTTVQGPVRLRFDTRFRFLGNESQSRQIYQLRVSLGGVIQKELEFASSSDLRAITTVDDQPELLGSRSVNYLEVGSGTHEIELVCTSPIYLRLEANRRAFAYPRLNDGSISRTLKNDHRTDEIDVAPVSHWSLNSGTHQATEINTGGQLENPASALRQIGHPDHIWQIDVRRFGDSTRPQQADDSMKRDPWAGARRLNELHDTITFENLALRSSRDNRFREGGIRAYMLMRAAAAARTEQPEIRELAERIRLHRTFFRNVLPSSQPFPVKPRSGVFSTWRMRDEDEVLPGVVLSEELIDDALSQLARARFVPTPTSAETPSVYAIPSNLGATLLRVAIDRSTVGKSTRLFVQYDNRKPIELLAFQHEPLVPRDYAPSRSAVALVAQHWQHKEADHATMGGAFSRNYQPAPYVAAGICELILPPGVSRIRVWSQTACEQPPYVAIQYRATRPHMLTETNYRTLAPRIDESEHLASLLQRDVSRHTDEFASLEIHNLYVPLHRLMATHRRAFEASVVDNRPSALPSPTATHADSSANVEAAKALMREGHYAAAIGLWTEISNGSHGTRRAMGLLSRADALRGAGEVFLADREFRGLYLFDEDNRLRRDAYERLFNLRRRDEQWFDWEQVISTTVLREANRSDINDLAAALVENGRYDLALHALLALPKSIRSPELTVRCAFNRRWWATFEEALPQLPKPQRQLWQARRLVYQGRYDRALQLTHAGREGQQMSEHLRTGMRIHDALRSTELTTRLEAVVEWEDWQANHPGRRTWREEPGIVAQTPGYRAVYHRSRDVYSDYYLSRPDEPVVLRVLGPVRLKLETRPIHQAGSEDLLDGWVEVTGENRHEIFPMTNNFASTELVLVDDERVTPGGLIVANVELGAGIHELRVHSDEADLLIRAFARAPEFPLPILPPLNFHTFTSAVLGQFTCSAFGPKTQHEVHMLAGLHNPPVRLPMVEPIPTQLSPVSRQSLENLMELVEDVRSSRTVPAAVSKWGKPSLSSAPQASRATAAGNDTPHPIPDQHNLLQRMAHIVRKAERDPSARLQAICDGMKLVESHSDVLELRRLQSRLMRGTTWEQFREYESSAGVHSIDVSTWEPETPALRIRRSLMHSTIASQIMLQANTLLVWDVSNARPRDLDLMVQRPPIGYLPNWPTVFSWQIDDQPAESTTLTGNGANRISVSLPAGRHQVRMSINNPLANHMVLINVKDTTRRSVLFRSAPSEVDQEVKTPAALPGDDAPHALRMPSPERFYQIANTDQPVEFSIPAPAVVRIDEFTGDNTKSRTVVVSSGERTFSLTPAEGQEVAMFRVFELAFDADHLPSKIKRRLNPPQPVAPPLLERFVDGLFKPADPEALEPLFGASGPSLGLGGDSGEIMLAGWETDSGDSNGLTLRDESKWGGSPNPEPDWRDPDLQEAPELFEPGSRNAPIRIGRASNGADRLERSRRSSVVSRSEFETELANKPDLLAQFNPFANTRPDSDLAATGIESPDNISHDIDWLDAGPLDGQLLRTWSYSLGAFQRRPIEESQNVGVPGRFLQFDIGRWAYDEWRDGDWTDRYTETHFLVRARNASGPTLGFTHDAWQTLPDVPSIFPDWSQSECEAHPLTLHWRMATYMQFVDPVTNGDDVLWSGQAQAGLSQRFELNERWDHRPSLTAFVRPLSTGNTRGFAAGDVDQDLFTPYKSDHRWGIRFADRFTFRSRHDVRWWFRPSMTMNETIVTPDNIGLQIGSAHLLGPLDIDLSYRLTGYLKDADRSRATLQHVAYLNAILEHWQTGDLRHEFGWQLRHDIGESETSGNLTWTVFHNDRRAYRDVPPGRRRFLPAKRRNAFRSNSMN